MIETQIWMALKNHINAYVHLPVVMPTEQADLDTTQQQVLVSFIPNISERPFMENDSIHYYDGILQLTLMSPLNRNQENIIHHASRLIGAFPESSRIVFGGIRVHIPKRGDMTQTYRDGGMWRTPINIRYRAFATNEAWVPLGELSLRHDKMTLLDGEESE